MSDEKKPIPMAPGESASPIRLGGTTLASLIGSAVAPRPGASMTIAASVPPSHQAYSMGAKTGAEADAALAAAQAAQRAEFQAKRRTSSGTVVGAMFAKGDTVVDAITGRKGTITKLNVAFSEKNTPYHKIIDRHGNAWRQKETKLTKL